jgi:hypothetical protein
MERAVRENDYVLVVCTPTYKSRSNERSGGIGYEGDIMTAEVFASRSERKFIPLLRIGSDWTDASPSWLQGKYYVDFRGNPYKEERYRDLLTTLHGVRPKAPPIGKRREANSPSSALDVTPALPPQEQSESVTPRREDFPSDREFTIALLTDLLKHGKLESDVLKFRSFRKKSSVGLASLSTVKRASLLFDQVVLMSTVAIGYPPLREALGENGDDKLSESILAYIIGIPPESSKRHMLFTGQTTLFQDIMREHKEPYIPEPTLVLSADDTSLDDIESGPGIAYCAVLDNIPTVIEDQLSWRQIVEFRSDIDAVKKYRSLQYWLSDAMAGKSLAQARDIIEQNLSDYHFALRKHGVDTRISFVRTFLDPKSLVKHVALGAGAALVTNKLGAAMVGGLSLLADVYAAVEEWNIKKEALEHSYPIAILYDIRKHIAR